MKIKFYAKPIRGSQGKFYIYIPKAIYPNINPDKRYLIIITDEENGNE